MATAGRSRRPVGDLTGRQSEEMAARAADQLAERSGQISTTNPLPITIDDGTMVDLTNPAQPRVQHLGDDDITADEQHEIEANRRRGGGNVVEIGGTVEISERTRLMRVSEKIDPVIGFGVNGPNEYHFEPGVLYKVPEIVYDHLDEIGYVYH